MSSIQKLLARKQQGGRVSHLFSNLNYSHQVVLLLFQLRLVESRDAGPWMHRRNPVYGGLTVVMCDGAGPLSPVLFKGRLCF